MFLCDLNFSNMYFFLVPKTDDFLEHTKFHSITLMYAIVIQHFIWTIACWDDKTFFIGIIMCLQIYMWFEWVYFLILPFRYNMRFSSSSHRHWTHYANVFYSVISSSFAIIQTIFPFLLCCCYNYYIHYYIDDMTYFDSLESAFLATIEMRLHDWQPYSKTV